MLNTDSFIIIDPYNWWPNSHELFEGFNCLNIDFIFVTNFENSRIRAKKLFKRKNFLMKALECFYLIPYLLVKYRKCNVILMWLPLPILNHLSLFILKLLGSNHYLWVHNSIPHSLARFHKNLKKLSSIFWPLIANIITMNKEFYDQIKNKKYANCFYIDIGVSEKEFKEHRNKKYTFGLFGRFEKYKYPNGFIENLESYCAHNNLNIVACGKNALSYLKPSKVIDVYDGFVSKEKYDELMDSTKVVLCPYIYIDMSGVISTCIEKNIFWYANSVGNIKSMEDFSFCHEELIDTRSFIDNALSSFKRNKKIYSLISKDYIYKNNWKKCAKDIKTKFI